MTPTRNSFILMMVELRPDQVRLIEICNTVSWGSVKAEIKNKEIVLVNEKRTHKIKI